MTEPDAIPLAGKLAALRDPGIFPDRPERVEVVETHWAYVFLSRDRVYKLKKPVQRENLDLRTLAARRANCRKEVDLNRRLARDVYLGVAPLVRTRTGWAIGGDGVPVEWLVEMRRLPAERMLDRVAERGPVRGDDLDRVMGTLSAFYGRAQRPEWSGEAYVARLHEKVRAYRDGILHTAKRAPLVDEAAVRAISEAQHDAIERHRERLCERAAARRIVDAHGDLKPEHVCLLDPPEIIDCLEFDDDLRLLDTAEEIAFLALECERLGHPRLATAVRERYVAVHGDACPDPVWRFHRSLRALVRAFLGVGRLVDDDDVDREAWAERTRWYLARAREDLP